MNVPLDELQELMQKEMSRKEFLRIVGAGVLGIIGVTGLLQNLHKLAGAHTKQNQSVSGYGSSPYGK